MDYGQVVRERLFLNWVVPYSTEKKGDNVSR